MNRHAMKNQLHRKDSTQKEILAAIRKEWPRAKIHDTSMVGDGFPDAVMLIDNLVIFGEWKTKKHPHLTADEMQWHAEWYNANIIAPRAGQEAVAMILAVLRGE